MFAKNRIPVLPWNRIDEVDTRLISLISFFRPGTNKTMPNICRHCHYKNPETATFCAGCGTELGSPEQIDATQTIETAKEEITIGSTFAGRYQIVEELGKGGMGRVYKVVDTEIKETIALKLLKPEISGDKKTIERFSNELKTARKISHKNICRAYHLGKHKGNSFITMEYVQGEDLKRLIRKVGQINIAKAVATAVQVCDGLEEAHRLGVVHRDLKPSNILVDEEGNARIMDFGIARSLESKGITGAGVMIGTPEYMSPEQVEGKEVDLRSDLYSLGVVLYEMVTGKVPFEGDTPFSIAVRHKSEAPQDPKELQPQIPGELNRVILKCLEKNKEKRYQSVGEVRSDLQKVGKSFPKTERVVTGRKPITSREITLKFDLKKLIVPALVLIVLLMVAGILLFHPAKEALNISIDSTQQITLAEGLEVDPSISPDGKMIAYAAGPEGNMHLFIRQIAGGRTIALTEEFPGSHRAPQWSPDGTRIAFFSEEGIYLVPALGGIPKQLVGAGEEGLNMSPAWSPAGKEIAYAQGNAITSIPVDGGEPRKVAETYEPHSLCWSPDGLNIAYVSGNSSFVFGKPYIGNIAPSSIWVVPAAKGPPIQLTETTTLNMSPVWTPDGRHLLFVSNRGGSRDIYMLTVDDTAKASQPPDRLTTGLDAHTISLSSDGSKLAYSVFSYNANIWSIRIPEKEAVSVSEALAVTKGTQGIEGIGVSPDGQWLAFDSNRNGNQDVFKMPLGGGEYEQLTTHPSDDFLPSWSPDGSEIAFYSFRKGNRDIHLMTSEGGSVRQITDDDAQERYPDWSPDGNRLVFYSDKTGRQELFTISRDNKDSEWSDPVQLTFDGGLYPRWSPDGRFIVYIRSQSLCLIAPEGGEPRVLVDEADPALPAAPQFAVFSPDSQKIYYKAEDDDSRASFWSIAVSGGKPELLVHFDDPSRKFIRVEFDTDGTFLYFTLTENKSDIWVMNLQIEKR